MVAFHIVDQLLTCTFLEKPVVW